MATVFPLVAGGLAHFDDDQGVPLQGGLVYFYVTLLSAPKDTYSNAAGSSLNTNPVELDSRGEASIYLLGDEAYKMVVKDSDGNTIYTRDPVSGVLDVGYRSAAETSPATGDKLILDDVSEGALNAITLLNLLKIVTSLTAETSVATDDELLLYDLSEGAANKVTLANLLKVINSLTEDTTPDVTADFLITYDISASAVKKVLLNNLTINGAKLTANSVPLSALTYYESSETTITANTKHEVTHGLGGVPNLWTVSLKNTSTDVGYAAGDQVVVSMSDNGTNAQTAYANATKIGYVVDNSIELDNQGSPGSRGSIDMSKWKLVFRAWR